MSDCRFVSVKIVKYFTHRAELIKDDNATGLALFNQHTAQYGYMIEASEEPVDTLTSVFDQIMALFK